MNKYLKVKDISKLLGIPLRTVYYLIKTGKIKSIRFGNQIRCLKSDIEKYLLYGTDISLKETPIREGVLHAEKRAYQRINSNFKCQYSVNLEPFKTVESDGGIIKNISDGGVFVATLNCHSGRSEESQNIKVDDPIIIKFSLPFKEKKREEINVTGRVLRKQENGFAVKFRHIDQTEKEQIKEYIG